MNVGPALHAKKRHLGVPAPTGDRQRSPTVHIRPINECAAVEKERRRADPVLPTRDQEWRSTVLVDTVEEQQRRRDYVYVARSAREGVEAFRRTARLGSRRLRDRGTTARQRHGCV